MMMFSNWYFCLMMANTWLTMVSNVWCLSILNNGKSMVWFMINNGHGSALGARIRPANLGPGMRHANNWYELNLWQRTRYRNQNVQGKFKQVSRKRNQPGNKVKKFLAQDTIAPEVKKQRVAVIAEWSRYIWHMQRHLSRYDSMRMILW